MSAVSTAAVDASTAVMRAGVLEAPGRIAIREVPRPEPGPGQVRIRLEGSGVCGSDMAPWRGASWFEYPFEPGRPGHEGWGVVDAAGPGVEAVAVGTRVATLASTAYAAYALADAEAVVPLPSSLDGQAFPAEPLGCAMNIFGRSEIGEGDRVAIVGVGFLGALLTQLALDVGARVLVASRRGFAREIGLELGADAAHPVDDPESLEARVREWTGGELCDRVIEATGKQAGLDAASRLVRVRGRLVIAGFHQGGPRTVDLQGWNWRGIDVINAHERDPAQYVRGIRDAITAVESGRLDPRPLLTHTFPLDRLDEALATTDERPDGFLKAVVLHDER